LISEYDQEDDKEIDGNKKSETDNKREVMIGFPFIKIAIASPKIGAIDHFIGFTSLLSKSQSLT
jgi:hypothetical protein